MHWRIRKIYRSLGRLIAWAPIIWNNEEWDWAYLFELMEFKLQRMENEQRFRCHHLNRERYARQIMVCKNLLKRLREDNYAEKEFDQHREKWGECVFIKGELGRSKVTEGTLAQERHELRRIYAHKELQTKQDLEYFTLIFKKYVFHWWT